MALDALDANNPTNTKAGGRKITSPLQYLVQQEYKPSKEDNPTYVTRRYKKDRK